MKYTVVPRAIGGDGQFSVPAADEREALVVATRWLENGCDVVIIGCADGLAYDARELERVLHENRTA